MKLLAVMVPEMVVVVGKAVMKRVTVVVVAVVIVVVVVEMINNGCGCSNTCGGVVLVLYRLAVIVMTMVRQYCLIQFTLGSVSCSFQGKTHTPIEFRRAVSNIMATEKSNTSLQLRARV